MQEIWKDIQGYEGYYQVSNLGRVKSLNYKRTKKEKILKPNITKVNYQQVHLCKNKQIKILYIHRLVAEMFIPNPNNFPIINHKDENPMNNIYSNLEWCDKKYNLNYGTAQERKAQKHNKPILQFDLDSNFIKEYESITQASKELNIKIDYISSCCLGRRRKTKGYVFKFKNDKDALKKYKEIIGDDK